MPARADVGLRVRRLRGPLLRWYRRAKRDLPWRRTKDPYAIWVSEAMLQQTTVAAVVPYWERFLQRFPDVAELAAGGEEEVLAMWSGLGYYRRARALREGAIAVMERHDGRVPDDPQALRALPGIGPYTAGAIASLAFGRQTPVVDGNVERVLARLFGIGGRGASVRRGYWSLAEALVKGRHPGDLNQALMELGATVCTPRAPRCPTCPVRGSCRARALGDAERFPAPRVRRPVSDVRCAAAWIERSGRVLLVRRHADGPLRGTWDIPVVVASDPRASARDLRARLGTRVRPGRVLASVKHTMLGQRLTVEVLE